MNMFVIVETMFFSIWNHHKYLSQLFLLHLNTYVMGTTAIKNILVLSARLYTSESVSTDVRFWRIKTVPALEGLKWSLTIQN